MANFTNGCHSLLFVLIWLPALSLCCLLCPLHIPARPKPLDQFRLPSIQKLVQTAETFEWLCQNGSKSLLCFDIPPTQNVHTLPGCRMSRPIVERNSPNCFVQSVNWPNRCVRNALVLKSQKHAANAVPALTNFTRPTNGSFNGWTQWAKCLPASAMATTIGWATMSSASG